MTKLAKILGFAKEETKSRELELELSELRAELSEANGELKKLREKISQTPTSQELADKVKLYEIILSRYREHIEKEETKTIPLIKKMIQSSNSHILALAETLKHSESPFKSAYEYITIKIASVPAIQTTFWLTISEMLNNGIATYEDKAILLCSLFRALGGESRVIIAQMSDGSDRPFVLLAFGDKTVLCDPNEKHGFLDFSGTKDEIIEKYAHNGNKIQKLLYEFDDKEYVQHGAE